MVPDTWYTVHVLYSSDPLAPTHRPPTNTQIGKTAAERRKHEATSEISREYKPVWNLIIASFFFHTSTCTRYVLVLVLVQTGLRLGSHHKFHNQ